MRNRILDAGVKAYRGLAMKQAAKQAVRGVASEVAEEGVQDLITSVDERLMGNEQMTGRAMFDSAVDAMLDAVPAAIGMTLPGAALHGAGSYRAMKSIDRAMLGDAKEEVKREGEKSMMQKLVEIAQNTKLRATSPEAYAKTIQNQMKQAGMETMYVDAASAVESEKGQAALNQLIEDKVVTAKEVNDAVTKGTQLEISPGAYFQTATPETTEAIADYSTFDKGGRTLAAIKESRAKIQKGIDAANETYEQREATAIKGILDKDFTDPKERAVMEEVLPGNLDDIPKAVREKIKEVKSQLADITGAQSKIDYIKGKRKSGRASDVGVIDVVGESGQYESKRVSGNEGWYSSFYKDNKKAPTIRDAYDIAYKEALEEAENTDSPEAQAAAETMTSLMEKLETLEGLQGKVESMDTKDIMARTLLDEDAFNKIYTPAKEALMQGNPAVREAAAESALVNARVAQAFHEAYGEPYENIAKIVVGGNVNGYNQYMSPEDQLKVDVNQWNGIADQFTKALAVDQKNNDSKYTAVRKWEGHGNDLVPFMGMPAVFQMLGIKYSHIKAYKTFFRHALTQPGHAGMTMKMLRELPQKIVDPVMILQGKKPDTYMVVLDTSDKNGAPATAIIEIQKSISSNAKEDMIITEYGLTEKADGITPNYEAITRAFQNNEVIYMNNKKSAAWLTKNKGASLSWASPNSAFNKSIIAKQQADFNQIGIYMRQKKGSIKNEKSLKKWKAKHPTYYQLAGQNALTADRLKLQQAQAMEGEGKSDEDIWNETGWMKGKDGKWRFEIPDDLDKIELTGFGAGSMIPLSVVYDNPKLYEAYPDLKQVIVSFEHMQQGSHGYATPYGIALNIDDIEKKPEEAKSTLVHEIQHMIQAEEHFAPGGSPNTVRNSIANTKDAILEDAGMIIRDSDVRMAYFDKALYEWYLQNGDTQKAKVFQMDWNAWKGKLSAKSLDIGKEKEEKFKEKAFQVFQLSERINKEQDQIDAGRRTWADSDYRLYRDLAGEQEAREAEHRARQMHEQKVIKAEIEKAEKEFRAYKDTLLPEEQKNLDQFMEMHANGGWNALSEDAETMLDLYESFGKKGQAIVDALMEARDKLKEARGKDPMGMPHPHNENAIVVFGGYGLPFSTESPYFQTVADPQDYVVYHNISEENLMKSAKLGGLPVPSIAITRKGIPFGQFGEITLIGTRNMVDPARGTDVWSRDAYTTRFPTLVYDTPKEKNMSAFMKRNEKAFNAIGEENELNRIRSSILYTSDRFRAERELSPSRGMMYRYVTEELGDPISIPMKAKENTVLPEIMSDDVRHILQNMKEPPTPDTPLYKELSQKVEKAMWASFEKMANGGWGKRWSEEKKKERAVLYKNRYLDEDGNVKLSVADRLYEALHGETEKIIDTEKLDAELRSKIDRTKYAAWIEKELDTLFDAPKIELGRKKVPLTLANIVEAMTRKQGAGQEMGFTVSDNNVLAKGSREFKSIEEMKAARDSLVTNEEGKAAYDEFVDALSAFRKEGEESFSGNAWQELDAANIALGDALKAGGTKAKLAAALRREGFKGITVKSSMVAKGMLAMEAAKKVKTDYFEAKPSRAVSFNEFKGAVVPKGTSKEAIDFLKSQGMKIAEYDPDKPEDRQAKQEQLAAETQSYFQSQGERIGAYDPAKNLIAVFNGANQSTVIHETAHVWLTMLEKVAETNEKAGQDLYTIQKWGAFSEENIQEYKGTSLEKEFFGYADTLRKNPNDLATQERYIQERFARAFERYLMTGSAPSKEMRGVFHRFKEWLLAIYQDIKNLGKADPPEDVRRIFDSMLATQKEVDAWAAQRKLTAMNMNIDFSKTEKENFDAWAENIKETVKEKCLKHFMEETKESAMKDFNDTLESMRDQWWQELIQQHPIYQFELTRELHPTRKDWRNYLAENGMDEESYQKALRDAGGSLEDVIEARMKEQRDQYIANVLTPDMIRQTAEAVMQSPEGQAKRAAMEADAIRKRLNQYIRTVTLATMELDRAADKKKVARDIKERLGLLTNEDKHQMEKEKLESQVMNAEDEAVRLKAKLSEMAEGLKTAREGLAYPQGKLRQQAESMLSDEKISKATNWKWWDNKARSASIRAGDALKKKDWSAVAFEKQNELHYAMMARVAKEYEDEIRKDLRGNPKASVNMYDKDGLERYGILGIVNRIGRTDKPVRMSNQSRYFVQHMAYQLGLTNTDGVAPIDTQGRAVEFSWSAMAMELNPTQAMSAAEEGNVYLGDDVISPWLKSIFEGKQQTAWSNLTYNEFKDIITAMKAVYKMGRREYEGNTLGMSFDDAAFKLIRSTWAHRKEDPFYAKNRRDALQRIAKRLHHAVDTLTLPEILWERLGPDWYKLFYQTIDKAYTVKRQMTADANTQLNAILSMYSHEEWRQMRSKKLYQMGVDEYGNKNMVTKEALISAALNWGNRTNRDRLMETYRMDEGQIEDVLFANLTEKDWDFVEKVWAHIGSYWDGRNLAQNNTLGVPLGKVHGIKFKLPNGREIHGAYYPIKYDPDTSVRAQERDANEIVKSQMQGVSTFALGMGSTKKRGMASGDQRLRTDLDVYIEHVNESVQHISMREATVDVYKLITRKDVMDELVTRVGMDQYNILKRWAADQWHSPMDKMTGLERFLNRTRGKMTFATMAYRFSTAALNATNIFPMMDRMGAGNAVYAIGDMYCGNYQEKRKFILEKSSFMRERATNIDRDLMRENKLPVAQNTWRATAITEELAEKTGKWGYAFITETDFMLSLPQWLATYKGAILELTQKNEKSEKKLSPEDMEAEAVRRADKAVRETFGSGEMKDQANLLKGKYIQQFLPFYSYTGLVLNQFIRAGYMVYDGKGVGQLMKSIAYWWILSAVADAASAGKALTSEQNASMSESSAKASEQAAKASEETAAASASHAAASEENARTSEDHAREFEGAAKASQDAASQSESNAAESERNAKQSETNAKASETAVAASHQDTVGNIDQGNQRIEESAGTSAIDRFGEILEDIRRQP